MPSYKASASWWVGAAVMASFVIFTPEGVTFTFTFPVSSCCRFDTGAISELPR